MKKTILILSAIILAVAITSCKKKVKGCMDPISINYNPEAEVDDASCEYGGVGGSVTIVAFPKHHGNDTRPYHAYVKFNAQEFPGTNPALYDLDVVADTTENHIEIETLKPGKYYIYITAYDTSISAGVVGGIPVIVTQSSGEVDINVPVTE